jgi:ABC-type glycerol-3-phosphate transport system substrate-binding protein
MLGTISLDPYLREAILEFNNRNQRYRVEVKDYATPGDHEAGELAFHLALTTTGGLDLVAFGSTSYGEFTNLATKGALEDLQPYFEGNGLDRRDYFENILDLYAIEGKLYGATPGFTLGALAAHASKLEGIDGWTVAEMMAWAEGYPGAILLDAVPLYILILLDAGRFIDWENGEVSYASDEFISVLELAATFDNAWDFQETEPLGMHESFASGYYLLYQAGITDLTDMQFVDALFDGEAKYMGYPAADGGDIFVVPRSTLAISSQSEHKEGAFAFLAYLLSDAYQVRGEETSLPFIPIKKSGAEALVAWQTTERRGVLGEQSLTSWEMDDLNVEIYASRNRDYVNDFYDLIARADTMRANDSAVLAIVREEAESYFAGQKTAWEAAEIIQNRVQVYVNEGR